MESLCDFSLGLDSFNAFNVVESLVSLARDYNRTVIFTIHQPRSNIVALFDQLTVLAAGKLVYSGAYAQCQEYFTSIGYPCPAGFNIADYLSTMFFPAFTTCNLIFFVVDLTMQPTIEPQGSHSPYHTLSTELALAVGDEEQGLPLAVVPHSVPISVRSITSDAPVPEDAEPSVTSSTSKYLRKKTSQVLNAVSKYGHGQLSETPISPGLAVLVQAYAESSVARDIRIEGAQAASDAHSPMADELSDTSEETLLLRGRKRVSWATQFRILSGRAFKNLYRDPALLTAHYLSAIALAGE